MIPGLRAHTRGPWIQPFKDCSWGAVATRSPRMYRLTGLLSNQGEKSINFYFIMVPLRKKVLKYGTPKPS